MNPKPTTLDSEACVVNGLTERTIKRLVWDVGSRLVKHRKVTVRLFSGDRFVVRVGDQLSRAIFCQGCHEPVLTSLVLGFLRPGMTVFDIGANIGYYTVLMARRVGPAGTVHAFEINENALDLLEENVRSANLRNVRIVNRAVARTTGKVEFFVPHTGEELEGSLRRSKRYEAAGVVTVPSISVDDYIEENDIRKVDFIKIDVEGAEYEAFEGAKNLLATHERPAIMFEALDSACVNFGVNWLDIVEKVKEFGYRIHQGDTANFFATPVPSTDDRYER